MDHSNPSTRPIPNVCFCLKPNPNPTQNPTPTQPQPQTQPNKPNPTQTQTQPKPKPNPKPTPNQTQTQPQFECGTSNPACFIYATKKWGHPPPHEVSVQLHYSIFNVLSLLNIIVDQPFNVDKVLCLGNL